MAHEISEFLGKILSDIQDHTYAYISLAQHQDLFSVCLLGVLVYPLDSLLVLLAFYFTPLSSYISLALQLVFHYSYMEF